MGSLIRVTQKGQPATHFIVAASEVKGPNRVVHCHSETRIIAFSNNSTHTPAQ